MLSTQAAVGIIFALIMAILALNIESTVAAPMHMGGEGGSGVLQMLAAGAVVKMLMEHF